MEEMGPQVWDQQWARSWERRLATDIILQDVIGGSDRSAALQLTSLMEGVYTFRLQVVDGQGALDTDTATVEVRPGVPGLMCWSVIWAACFRALCSGQGPPWVGWPPGLALAPGQSHGTVFPPVRCLLPKDSASKPQW